MPRRRALACLSVCVHALVFSAIVLAQLFVVGPWPTPRQALAYAEARIVHPVDITLQPSTRRSTTAHESGPSSGATAAPIAAPVGVTPETGLEGIPARPSPPGITSGMDGLGDVGRVENPPPPPAPPPVVAPTRLHGGMQPPRKVVDVVPVYPALARSAHIEGVVILEVVIDAKGQVESVRVLRSIQTLDQAAVDAVRQWQFTPTLLSGHPIPIVMTVTVNFQLSK